MKNILLLVAALFAAQFINAQHYYNPPAITPGGNPGNLNYNIERPYGNGLPSGWTNIQPATHPGWSAAQSLPFSFTFNSQTFNSVKVSTTGLVTFTANPSPPSGNHNVIPHSSVPDNTICVWGLGYSGGNSNDKIVTKTFGSTPNRQFWITWNSYNNESLGNKCYTYWSVVLEESSNKVYIVDQLSSTKSSCDPLLTLGLQYSSSSALMVTGSPNIHPLASNSSSTVDNVYYEFIPGQRPNYDMAVDYIQTNHYQTSSTPVEVRGIVKSYGLLNVSSYDINYQLDNGPVQKESVSGSSIAMWSDEWYFHDSIWMATGLGVHQLKVWADNINGNTDQNPYNDTLYKEIEVMGVFVPKVSLHEYFNSSNHDDCAGAMDSLRNVFTQHPGEYTVISYQMGTDSYNTSECDDRATYYGIDSLPDMYVNGLERMDPRYYNAIFFNDFKEPSYISVTPKLELNGNTVRATAAILPFPDWTNPPNGMKIRVAVVELMTTGNAGTNGDTKFYSVLRKFLPAVTGINQASFTPGLYVNIDRSFTFNTGDVEDINNLGVVVYIQNDVTGEVYQSGFAQINTGIEDQEQAQQGILKLYPNPGSDAVGVSYFLPQAQAVTFNLMDLTGRKIATELIGAQGSGAQTHWLDTRKLPEGIYFVEMLVGSKTFTKKLIINR
jgi:hypothetical protein